MATRNGRSTGEAGTEQGIEGAEGAAAEASPAMPAQAADFTRQQLVAAATSTAALFRRLERLQLAQQHLAQRAALLHSQAADNLRKATTPMELATIQGTLLMYQWQEGARFWQELLAAGTAPGGESPQASAAEGVMGSPAAAATAAAMNAAAPMVQAWQQLFTPAADGQRPH
ncbi:MAG: hypothetical protein EOO24_34035 [Comamonadaceae bacterium]|nr:MAG: hypothetical protein EOO24_34035 [Comamonadaceae bacterium]